MNESSASGKPGAGPLDGEVALVTGGAQGLGLAIATALAAQGAAVALGDIDAAQAAAAAERIAARPATVPGISTGETAAARDGRAFAVAVDVTDPASLADAVATIGRGLGPVSILVNSAVFARYGPLDEIDPEVLDRMLAVGLKGPLLAARAVAPGMKSAGRGLILNLSSVVGLVGVPYSSAYAALKGGIDAITRALAVELGPAGIRVNSIAPSAIPNRMSNRTLDARGWEERRRRTPLGLLGSEQDVAAAAVYLASTGRFVNGVVLPVDGGFSMAAMIAGVDVAAVQRSRDPAG